MQALGGEHVTADQFGERCQAVQAPTQSARVDTSSAMPSRANDWLCRLSGWCSPNLASVSVHAGGGVLGGSAVQAAVGLRWPSGQSAKVELQDFNLKRARGPDDRREIGAGRAVIANRLAPARAR